MREARKNEAAVRGQRAQKVKPCARCGTFADVKITHAVPVEDGGHPTSEWNEHPICGQCRAERAEETLTGNSTIYPNGGWDRRGHVNESDGAPGHPGTAVAKGDRIFRTLSQAAREFGVSVTTVFRWVENGHNGWRRAGA